MRALPLPEKVSFVYRIVKVNVSAADILWQWSLLRNPNLVR